MISQQSLTKIRRQFLRDFRLFGRKAKQFKRQDFTKIKNTENRVMNKNHENLHRQKALDVNII